MTKRARHRSVGFTLVEVLVASAISAVLLVGLAETLGLFGREVQAVKSELDKGPDEAMALMTDMSRYGWSVEHPAADRLDIVDATGGLTTFKLADGDLLVTRPSGATGKLLSDVASLDIVTDAVRRLRDAPPRDDYRTWWQGPAVTSPATISLESGLPVALGFTLSSVVPDEYNVVEGVDEHTEFASLETLVISLAYVGNTPTDPNLPISGGSTGPSTKVTICHVPPGNPANAHSLSISTNALAAHLAHGDLLGTCEDQPDTQVFPDVTIQLFEARAPDDARPVGLPLASMTLVALALPVGTASWSLAYTGFSTHTVHNHSPAQCAATTSSGKVVMCHVPPGHPEKAHSIIISPAAVPAHLAHGDYFGCCGAHSVMTSVYTLTLNAQPTQFAFDISPLGSVILPGRAYTLVLSMAGPGELYIGASSLVSSTNTGVAQATQAWGDLQPMAMTVPFQLKGMQRTTQTAEHEPISRVSLKLQMADGKSVSGSASVASQSSVPGEWLGTIPGEPAGIDP